MAYLDELSSLWESVKLFLKEKYGPAFVNLWFENLTVHSYEDGSITFSTISEFKYNLINDKHLPIIKEGFTGFLGFEPDIKVIFTGEHVSAEQIIRQAQEQDKLQGGEAEKKPASIPTGVIPQNYKFAYTFDNFIVGNSNKFAHAAAMAVAEKPSSNIYNPLFIHGNSGVGKTTLLNRLDNSLNLSTGAISDK